jgi:hypothetical protein
MAIGVFAIAALELRVAVTDRRSPWYRRLLLATSGLAVWAPMSFAVAWAFGQHWNIPALSVPDMVRWHGLPNAIGFVIAGLAAARVRTRQPRDGIDAATLGDRDHPTLPGYATERARRTP